MILGEVFMRKAGKIHEFRIPAEEYMVSDEKGIQCEPAFMKIDIPKKYGPGMILGEVFMRNYFTVFDRADGNPEHAQVGFARAKKGPAVDDRLRALTGGGMHTFKKGHASTMPLMQSNLQKTDVETKFHHKPGLHEGSSQLQTAETQRRFH